MINRRNFLKNASLFTLGGLMAGKVGNAVAAQPATSAAFEATAVLHSSREKYHQPRYIRFYHAYL